MKEYRKVLIVNQNSGYLTIDVANAFAKNYDEVVVMYGKNNITERTFDSKIKIQKTIAYNRTSTFKRLWTWGLCTIHLFFLLVWKYRKHKILYYTNPPTAYFNSLVFSNPFSIVVFDTYPNALSLIGVKPTSFFYKIWAKINKRVFKRAQKIITLSEGMKQQLLDYVDENKIQVVSIWPGSGDFKPIQKEGNKFLLEKKWMNKFIVLYSGNLGIGHKLEVLIEAAEGLRDIDEILFLFIGEGSKKRKLQDLVTQKQLNNVEFLTWQDASVLPYSLASGDLAVVALEPEATHASVPSKTFNYMAVGAPLLAIGSPGSELESLIDKHQIGLYVTGDHVKDIKEFILDLFGNTDKKQELSDRTFQASKNYHFSAADQYLF